MAKAVLIFDGDCEFCRFWVERWRDRTGDLIEYQPFQDPAIGRRFPNLPRERCARAVQLVHPDGRVVEAAHAVVDLLALSGRRLPLWAYSYVPGFGAISERVYRAVADHRPLAAWLTKLLWGSEAQLSTYGIARWLFFRLLGLVYFVAFLSLATQIRGLIGHDGILPAREYLDAVATWANGQEMGLDRFRLWPTLCWFGTSDAFLVGLAVSGVVLAALLVAGLAPVVILPLLWIGYLSLTVVSGEFLSYQWDALLLETGFFAMCLAPRARWDSLRRAEDPPRLARWLLWWLLFRLMFGSGIVKLSSGDPTWRGWTALAFHYETQPLPTPVAWYAHHLPIWFHKVSTAAVLFVELVVPWLMVLPRRIRTLACAVLLGLQALIAMTGNYAFFNLLAIALCLLLLDDAVLMGMASAVWKRMPAEPEATRPRANRPAWLLASVALVTVPVSIITLTGEAGVSLPGSEMVVPLFSVVEPFRSVNSYGLFAVMTTTRPQIVVEGSNDRVNWRPYPFKYQADDRRGPPRWVEPFQPRLDWQMWFAALSRYHQELWFQRFCKRLLEGSPSVLGLLAEDPFHGRPPRFVRAVLYQYHFADAVTRKREGVWWTRERLELYSPVLSLAPKPGFSPPSS